MEPWVHDIIENASKNLKIKKLLTPAPKLSL